MLSEEKKAIDNLFHLQHINTYLDLSKESFQIDNKTIIKWKESVDIVLNLITKLQKENEKKDKTLKLFEHECRKFKAFCRRVRRDRHDIDLFNQGQEQKCNQFLNLISGEPHWDYEGKYFDETDKEIEKLAKEKGE